MKEESFFDKMEAILRGAMKTRFTTDYMIAFNEEMKLVWDAIKQADYKTALEEAKKISEKHKNEIADHEYFSVLADYARSLPESEGAPIHKEALAGLEANLKKARGIPHGKLYAMYNEFYFQSGRHKEQYELGESNYQQYKNKHYHYSSGVGAAWYAKQLFERGNVQRGKVWARRSIEAWSSYHQLISNYYNSYVHLALAHGLLGEIHKMEEALNASAKLCGKDVQTFKEFVEIRDVIRKLGIM